MASLYPTAEEARSTCAIVDAAADSQETGTDTEETGADTLEIAPNRAGEGADEE